MQPGQSVPKPSKGEESRIAGRKPVDRATARNAVFINLFITPGLGSLMGRRFVEGVGQLLIAIAGFTLFVLWFVNVMTQYYGLINGQETEFRPRAWLGISGAITFAAAWLWALATSISLVQKARRDDLAAQNQGRRQEDAGGSK